jgi:Big-like domain-containing protein
MTQRLPLRAAASALLLVLAGCSNDLTLPTDSGLGLDLSRVDGDGQQGTVGAPLPAPLIVRVVASGNGVAGRRVVFSPVGDGAALRLEPDTALTNSKGEASSTWVLGTIAGQHRVEARLVADDAAPPPVSFSAEAVAGPPDTLAGASPLFRAGRRGEELQDPLVVRVADRFGNPVANAAVTWAVAGGDGEVSAQETRTGEQGTAEVTWTLGDRVGVQRVTATMIGVDGSPVNFSATVLF